MAARVGLVIPRWKVCSVWHLPSLHFTEGWSWWCHLCFLSVRYFISADTPRAQAWMRLWHSLMSMWVFHALPLHSHLHSDLLLVFLFSPPFGFTAHTQQQAAGSGQKAVFCLAESPKSGLGTPQAHKVLSSTSYLLEDHSGQRGAPFSLCPETKLIKLKAINFNSADPKLCREVFSGLADHPDPGSDAGVKVSPKPLCCPWDVMQNPRTAPRSLPIPCVSVPPSNKSSIGSQWVPLKR